MVEHAIVAGWRGPDSAGAIQIAALLAEALDQPLELTSAYRYQPVALSSRVSPSSGNEIRAEAAHARVQRARSLVPKQVHVRERVAPGLGIAETLDDIARDVDACLLVVGRDLDGEVTRSLPPHAPCPVVVSPFNVPLPGEQTLRRIGVADDTSPRARLAAVAADRLARAVGGQVRRCIVRADQGDPRARLVEASADLDLLVCGSHGRGRVLRAVLGSVSTHLVQGAHCPVMVVPPGVEQRLGAPLGLTTAGES